MKRIPKAGDSAQPKAAPRPRGRPRSFDRESALRAAMQVFWQKGYDAASLHDLTEAMGINPPSLYAAFSDKENLYCEAVELYRIERGEHIRRVLAEEPTARSAIERSLREAAVEFCRRDAPSGCLLTMSSNCSTVSAAVQASLARKRAMARDALRQRIQRGIDEGDVPASVDAGALADFFMTVFAGMATLAKDGASRKMLTASVDGAMRAWPEAETKPKRKSMAPA
jgi:AcrR family transcriptional regulator